MNSADPASLVTRLDEMLVRDDAAPETHAINLVLRDGRVLRSTRTTVSGIVSDAAHGLEWREYELPDGLFGYVRLSDVARIEEVRG